MVRNGNALVWCGITSLKRQSTLLLLMYAECQLVWNQWNCHLLEFFCNSGFNCHANECNFPSMIEITNGIGINRAS